nr:succinate dehydrogenase subunit 3 [Hypnea brasiliensis]
MRRQITTLNRPISPHLSIYNSQITSLSSIWHRITGVLLVFIIFWFNIISKLIFYFTINYNLIELQVDLIYVTILFLFYYHSLNGLRNILWSLSYGFEKQNMKNSFYILCFCLFLFNLV